MPRSIDITEVYNVTIELFCERGFGGTTTKEIAERAGVNEATLFRRFGTKAALMEAAIRHVIASAPFGKSPASEDVTADLIRIVEDYVATYAIHGSLVMTLFAQLPHHAELQVTASVLMQNLQNVARVLASHQEKDRIRPGDPIKFTIELIAPLAVIGFMKKSGLGPGHGSLDVEDYVRTYLNGHSA